MAAKGKAPPAKESKKAVKPTPVKKAVKKSKPTAKTTKKANKKVVQPKITQLQFEQYFFKLSYEQFVALANDWNEEKLKLKLEKHNSYDGWLNYFKTLSVTQLQLLSKTGLDILPAEAYAALSFWRDIMSNPSRIKNIHKAGLTGNGDGKDQKSITQLAAENDRYGVLKAIRDQLANRMQNNPGNRDTADLSKQLTEVMTQIADYERRLAPDKKTVLGDLLSDIPTGPTAPGSDIKDKRPAKDGGGHRRTSFASRVTISDVKGKK